MRSRNELSRDRSYALAPRRQIERRQTWTLPQHVARGPALGLRDWLRHIDDGQWVLWLCLTIAALLRFVVFPHGLSPTDTDEPNYIMDGLNLIEGVVPGHKYAPSAPITWLGALYAAIDTIKIWLVGGPELSGFSGLLRPVAALEAALFHLYADMSGLRLIIVAMTVVLSLFSVAAICEMGYRKAGWPGALVGGLLAASIPIYIDLSVQTRPYAMAWAFALIALAVASVHRGRLGALWSGILLGLAVGTHMDMARVAPLALLMRWEGAPDRPAPPWREFGTMIAAAIVTFLVAAPWYLTHLVDNLRQIISVRLLPPPEGMAEWLVLFNGGIAIACALTSLALLLAGLRRRWPELMCGLWLVLNAILALRTASHGLWHDGALVVATIALAPLGLAALMEILPVLRRPAPTAAIVLLLVAPPLWQGIVFAMDRAPSQSADNAVAWVEANIPAGTTVYEKTGIATPLPTEEAAARLWDQVAAPDAWVPKYIYDTSTKYGADRAAEFGLSGARPLRVMSEDRLVSDRGIRRRYDILGAPLEPRRPRYDLRLETEGSFYDISTDTIVERLCRDGGAFIDHGPRVAGLPRPVAAWPRPDDHRSTYVYWTKPGSCPVERGTTLSAVSR